MTRGTRLQSNLQPDGMLLCIRGLGRPALDPEVMTYQGQGRMFHPEDGRILWDSQRATMPDRDEHGALILYHGTSVKNALSIAKWGYFDPEQLENQSPKGVYASPHLMPFGDQGGVIIFRAFGVVLNETESRRLQTVPATMVFPGAIAVITRSQVEWVVHPAALQVMEIQGNLRMFRAEVAQDARVMQTVEVPYV